MEKIGFIGLGIMGKPMSLHLLDGGHKVTVLKSSAAAEALSARGATLASTPKEVAEQSDVVITCLPDSPEVEKIVLSENGVVEGISSGNLFIDMSTIAPATALKLNGILSQKGVEVLDAPVSGGEAGPNQQVCRSWQGAHNPLLIGRFPYFSSWEKTSCVLVRPVPAR